MQMLLNIYILLAHIYLLSNICTIKVIEVITLLETLQERVKLLKECVDIKTIEKLYLKHNNFKVVHLPLLFDLLEINIDGK